MLNRSTVDLESATVRTRYFGGRSLAAIADEMPILPVDSPGLPIPGPSFVAFAEVLGDTANASPTGPKKPRSKKTAFVRPNGPYLHALTRSVLYQSGLSLPVYNSPIPYVFQPGIFATNDPMGDSYGPQPCRLMVVGKCLGPAEASAGRPFVGPRSQPLWDTWDEAGIPHPSKEHPVYLTNLIRFVPPFDLARLPKQWVEDGVHLLMQEIAICRPQVMLLLGADALKAVFGPKARVADFRGRVADFEIDCRPVADSPPDIHRCKVIAAEHPAAVAMEPDIYPNLLAAVKLVAKELGFAAPDQSIPLDHQAVYTIQELEAAVKQSIEASQAGGYVSFDCEWEGRHPTDPGSYVYTVQWSHQPGHARTVFIHRCGGLPNQALPLDKAVPLLKKLFEGAPARGARLVAHFGKADLPWLLSIGVDLYPHFVGPDDDPPGTPDWLSGPEKSYFQGGFDTYVAAHSIEESQELKLEVLTATYAGIPRYDTKILEWRDNYCKEHKLRKSQLKGYGNIPEELLISTRYTSYDADGAGRLYLKFNGDPRIDSRGMLDSDRFARSCRKIFGIRMRAWGAWCEMERYGMMVDRDAQRDLRTHLDRKRHELMDELRKATNWPDLDLNKNRHKVELLFGDDWIDWPRQRPQSALTLGLTPYKTTDSSYGGVLWAEAMSAYESEDNSLAIKPKPAADRETITHKAREHDLVKLMRDVLFINTAMKITFRLPDQVDTENDHPDVDGEGGEIAIPDGSESFEAGLLSFVCGDERIRSVFGLVETGRASSSRPNMQNFSSRRDEQFNRILGWGDYAKEGDSVAKSRKFVTRSVLTAQPGWFLVFADLKGAEIVAAAIFSGDANLLEHARRNNLPENHPDYLDLHSDLANKAFNLNLPFSEIKKKHKPLRVAAKATRFGKYYGASSDTILRQALEETPDVTLLQIENLMAGHDAQYPDLIKFFDTAEQRPATHGWASNGFGGTRRFRRAGSRDRLAAQGRESKNWTCQGLVADAMNVGLGNAWYDMRRRKMRSRIILSVHDSAGFECPPDEVETVVDEILPRAFKDLLPITPTDLNGRPNGRPDCRFDIDVEVFRSWGVDIDESEWRISKKEVGAKS